MIDFHCHVDLYPKARDVYAGAIERNVFTWLVTTSPKAFQATSHVLEKHESVMISPELHPEIVADRFQELEMLLELIQNVAAVGEIGLDGSKRYPPVTRCNVECFPRRSGSATMLGDEQ
ncbi:TatD family hydrolase [Salmonella enterica]|uniref:TatD family hydrolase n=1 Tax=Salmonella enterica TaxID=28901 RepID=UPI001C387794|nr:TatD family hydrolase [Salmonella enterica]EHJ4394844.1 TatD family hydrolase [Salmonella enterica]EHJ8964598.1 TatD family hydrolase [Salmonella enterica]EHK2964743.1 TatD family hydrolase [Salmonella enterica]EHK3989868.1 TatD family hydrolase [Salmonella enterica]EHK4238363.1 TatD family hydrolase [Salmonella enterica]